MYNEFTEFLTKEISEIKKARLYKSERIIVSPQDAKIEVNTGKKVLNFCTNALFLHKIG